MANLIGLLAMGHGVRVANLDSAVGGDRAEQRPDDALLLIVPADEGVADVEEHGGVQLGHDAGVAGRHVQDSAPHRHAERWMRARVGRVRATPLQQRSARGELCCARAKGRLSSHSSVTKWHTLFLT